MKVSTVIKMLNEYPPDAEIYVEWWGREMFDHDEENPVTDEAWGYAVAEVEGHPDEWAIGTLYDQLENALYDQKKDKV